MGSPAARAGLRTFRRAANGNVVAGDVITAISGEPVADLDDLLAQLERRQPGESVTLSLRHNGQTRTQRVVLARAGPPQAGDAPLGGRRRRRLGGRQPAACSGWGAVACGPVAPQASAGPLPSLS